MFGIKKLFKKDIKGYDPGIRYKDLKIHMRTAERKLYVRTLATPARRTIIDPGTASFDLPLTIWGMADLFTKGKWDNGACDLGHCRKLGELLASYALGEGPAKHCVESFLKERKENSRWLRILILLDPADSIAALPWELLYLPGTATDNVMDGFLAIHRRISIVRYIDTEWEREGILVPPTQAHLLSVLAATGNPPAPIALQKRAILDAIGQKNTMLEHIPCVPASLKELRGASGFEIVHFFAHGAPAQKSGATIVAGRLLLEDSSDPATASVIATEVREATVVVFNACYSAAANADLSLYGICATVSRLGVPSVVGMQAEIRTDLSHIFATAFYEQVAIGEPIDCAVNAARRSLLAAPEPLALQAFVPILYQVEETRALGRVAASDIKNSETVERIASVREKEMSKIAQWTGVTTALYLTLACANYFLWNSVFAFLYLAAASVSVAAGTYLYLVFRRQMSDLRGASAILKRSENEIVIGRADSTESPAKISLTQLDYIERKYRKRVRTLLNQVERLDDGLEFSWPRLRFESIAGVRAVLAQRG
jgi:CHAT domain